AIMSLHEQMKHAPVSRHRFPCSWVYFSVSLCARISFFEVKNAILAGLRNRGLQVRLLSSAILFLAVAYGAAVSKTLGFFLRFPANTDRRETKFFFVPQSAKKC